VSHGTFKVTATYRQPARSPGQLGQAPKDLVRLILRYLMQTASVPEPARPASNNSGPFSQRSRSRTGSLTNNWSKSSASSRLPRSMLASISARIGRTRTVRVGIPGLSGRGVLPRCRRGSRRRHCPRPDRLGWCRLPVCRHHLRLLTGLNRACHVSWKTEKLVLRQL
jgi:hypothetical protein